MTHKCDPWIHITYIYIGIEIEWFNRQTIKGETIGAKV